MKDCQSPVPAKVLNSCFANLYDFADERILEVLVQFYAIVQQHILTVSIA